MTYPGDDRRPLSCEEVDGQHAAYVWGALEPDEVARVEEHRRQCPACHERLLASERVISRLDRAAPALAIVFIAAPEAARLLDPRASQFSPDQGLRIALPWDLFSGRPPDSSNRLVELRSSSGPGRGALVYDIHTWRGVLVLQDLA